AAETPARLPTASEIICSGELSRELLVPSIAGGNEIDPGHRRQLDRRSAKANLDVEAARRRQRPMVVDAKLEFVLFEHLAVGDEPAGGDIAKAIDVPRQRREIVPDMMREAGARLVDIQLLAVGPAANDIGMLPFGGRRHAVARRYATRVFGGAAVGVDLRI